MGLTVGQYRYWPAIWWSQATGRPITVPAHISGADLRFRVDCRSYVGRRIAKDGAFEHALTAFLIAHIQAQESPGLFVDVGANIGWHSATIATTCPDTQVLSFEPDPDTTEQLAHNLALNDCQNATIITKAAGSAAGSATLFRYKASNPGRHSLVEDYGRGGVTVEITTLDTELVALGKKNVPIHAMKIDVEGYEAEVLAGATDTLTRTSCVVTEYLPGLAQNNSHGQAVLDILPSSGFAPYRLSGGKPSPLSPEEISNLDAALDIIWLRDPPVS